MVTICDLSSFQVYVNHTSLQAQTKVAVSETKCLHLDAVSTFGFHLP